MKCSINLGLLVKRLAGVAVLIFLVTTVQAQTKFAPGSMMDKIQKRGYLTAGVRHEVPTMGYLNPATGKLEGIDVDLMKELAKAIFNDPTKVEFKAATTKTRIPLLQQGHVDVIAASMTITPDRAKEVDFSKPYIVQKFKHAFLKDSPIKTWADIPGKTICLLKGSDFLAPAYEAMGCKITRLELVSEMIAGLRARRFDTIFFDEWMIDGILATNPDFRGLLEKEGVHEPNRTGVAFAKGHEEWVEFFNQVLTNLSRSGKLMEIVRVYVPHAAPESVPKY
jgi:putative glutamine transport system substrate-binding protein